MPRIGTGPRHDRFLSARSGAIDQAGAVDGLGTPHPRPSRTGRPAGDQTGRAGPAHFPAGRLGGGEGRGARGEMLGTGREGSQAAEVREMARLREQPAVRDAALLRLVGARHLKTKRDFGEDGRGVLWPFSFPPPTPTRFACVLAILAGSNSTWVSPLHPFRAASILVSPTDNLMPRTG